MSEGLPDFDQTLDELKAAGCQRVVVQHLLLVPGQMYAEAMELPQGLACRVGAPLLTVDDDYDWLARELVQRIDAAVPTVLAVHGNTRNPQHNRLHMDLWARCEAAVADGGAGGVGKSRGGTWDFSHVELKKEAMACNRAHLVPLFLFPGGHVLDDLAWVSRLTAGVINLAFVPAAIAQRSWNAPGWSSAFIPWLPIPWLCHRGFS